MKNSMALLAMAASLGPASASFNFGSSWQNAGSYTCPGNSNNECQDTYKGGFDWSDLTTGSFDSYNGFNFKGWTCEDDTSSGKRTGSKVIKGSCGKQSTPSFGCGSNSGVDKFTVSKFEIDVEFDCRLEFHYSMSDGSTCKQSSSCKKGGNTISNSQCGGATDVQIVWPDQDTPKTECEIKIPSIDFDCGDNTPSKPTSSVPSHSKTKTHPGGGHETSTAVVPSKSHPGGPESSSVVPSKSHPGGPESSSVVPSKSHPGGPESSSVVPSKSHPGGPESSSVVPSKSHPGGPESSSTPIPSETGSSIVPSQSSPATTPSAPETTSAPVPSTTEENSPSTTEDNSPSTTGDNSPSSPSDTQTVPQTETQTTITTTWDSTSTIFTTSTRTITSCGPEIPDCPASGTPSTPIIVTETIPVTTTVCPVTETIVPSGPASAPVSDTAVPSGPTSAPVSGSVVPSGSTSVAVSGSVVPSGSTSVAVSHTSGNSPVQTDTPDTPLPCPDVVPKCLNSWLHLVSECTNNLDVACFCPNEEFVQKTFECLYSYGESDDIIAESVAFFQGICAAFVPQNPGIVTGIETITNILTVTGTPVVSSVPYTTIVYETTITQPCVSGGTTIPGSTTTTTISTEVTIPNISVPAPTVTAAPSTDASANPAQPTGSTLTTKPPVGTISQGIPSSTTTGVPIAAGNNVKASLGLGLAAMLFAAAL